MRAIAKPLRILVTDAHKLAGLGTVRSLGRAGHTVIAAYPQGHKRPPSVWSRYCSGEIQYPDSRCYQFEFRDWLRNQANRGTFDALFPVTEASIVGVASVRKEFPSEILAILPGDPALEYTLSKFLLTRMAISLGITCPPTVFISDSTPNEKWNDDFSALHFPIIIKTDNYLTKAGAYIPGRRFIATNADEASKILRNLEQIPTRVIAQEKIPGSGTGAFLLRFGGKTHLKFAHRRLHEVPYTGGQSSFRESCRDHELTNLGETLLDAIEYEGMAMVEFRRGAIDGKPYFLEVNGRPWGSLALALHSGIDFPKTLIECHQYGFASTIEPNYRTGIKCRNIFPGEMDYLISVLKAKTNNGIEPTPSKVAAVAKFLVLSLNPRIRHDYFWWSDPLPGVIQVAGTATMLADKIIEIGANKFQEYRGDRMLERLRSEHKVRCSQSRYFDRPINQVLFLCYGNICRSPFAEHYWNSKIRELFLPGPKAVSTGFHLQSGRKTPSWIADLIAEYNIDLTKHLSRIIGRSEVESADAIFIMDRTDYRNLIAHFPTAKEKTYFLGLFTDNGQIEIEDPYLMSNDNIRICYKQLVLSLDGLMKRILDT